MLASYNNRVASGVQYLLSSAGIVKVGFVKLP